MVNRAALLQQQLVDARPAVGVAADAPTRTIEIDLGWPVIRQALAGVFNRLGAPIERLAADANVDVPAVLAVWYVESGGRVHEPGRAVIRFENHVLFDLWGRHVPSEYDRYFQHGGRAPALGAACRGPSGGYAVWNCHAYRRDPTGPFNPGHVGQAQEYDILELARSLSGDDVALQCISMGGPQIMGFHYARLGFDSPREMYDAFQMTESAQVAGFFAFCRQAGAPGEAFDSIRRHDWANFARLYNGTGNVATYAALLANAHAQAEAVLALLEPAPAGLDELVTDLLRYARSLTGVPYEINLPGFPRVPGGRGFGKKYPDLDRGLDCSGYVLNVMQHLGELTWLDPDYTSCDVLWSQCEPITRAESRPGDMVFFSGTYNTAGFSHIGFVTEPGGQAMISARVPGVGEDSLTSGYFQSRLAGFGRPRRGGGPPPGIVGPQLIGAGGISPTRFRLDHMVALITGAGSERGIGRAIAAAYAAAGARVGLVDIDAAGAERNAAALAADGARTAAVGADVTDPASVARAVAQLERELGPIDILVNSAGMTRGTVLWETSLAEYDQVLNLNLRGGFICLQAVLGGMMARRAGRIIWISSISGKQGGGVFGSAHYAASKAGVIGLCHAAARQLGPYGITSNAIAPGLVTTDLVARAGGADLLARLVAATEQSTPVRRAATAEDVAYAALFLASDEASYVNGEIMDVNGGAYFD